MNFSSSAECPPPPCPLQTHGAGQARRSAFHHEYERRGDAVEHQQHGRDQKRQPVGFFERQILGHHLADHHVHEADRQKRQGETRAVQIHFARRRERKREQPQDGVVQRLLAGPAQPQTRQRDADLGDAQQPFGIRQQLQRGARGNIALRGQLRRAGSAARTPAPLRRRRRSRSGRRCASSNVKRRDILVRYNRSLLFNTPLLRAINLSIAVLLVALAGAAYWFAWRPLPQTSGEIAAPIAARATVARDALGVPHISAASWEDAIFLQGYVTAQDRMWQMDALRRLAAGELAEVVGPSALESGSGIAEAAPVAHRRGPGENAAAGEPRPFSRRMPAA